jgi:predicted Co/Zn/Cd cation transporter (cation efflux family)
MARSKPRRASRARPSLATTFAAILTAGRQLLLVQGRLLQAELRQKLGMVGVGLALAAAGGVLLVMAALVLLVAAIGALMQAGFSLAVAALIVFAALLVLGGSAIWLGLHRLQPENLVPTRTIEEVQKDLQAITLEPG